MREQVLETGEKLYIEGESIQSVWPPESFFGYSYFYLMVPPMKPSKTLILGYGNGVVSGLIQKVWGKCEVVGIDKRKPEHTIEGDTILQMDAYDYVDKYAKEGEFDFVVVDLYNGSELCPYVGDEGFAKRVGKASSLRMALNVHDKDVKKILGDDGKKSIYENMFHVELIKPFKGQSVVFFKRKPMELEVV